MKPVFIAGSIALFFAGVVLTIENEFHLRILFMVCVYLLCAEGMNVLVGYAGQKSLGQAGLFAVGAYTVALMTSRYGIDPWVSLLAASFMSVLFGILIAIPSLRVQGPSLAMVTLAFGLVMEKVVTEATGVFGGAMGIYAIRPLTFFGSPFTMKQWVWFSIALCFVFHILLGNVLRGKVGRALLAVQYDELAAGSVGVSVYRYKIIAFVIAALTCGMGGALVAQQNQYINSDFVNFPLSVFILLLVLFGGAASRSGPFLGSFILVILGAFLARWPWLEHLANGALLLFALYLMPKGVAGALGKAYRKLREKGGAAADEAFQHKGRLSLPVRESPMIEKEILQATDLYKAFGGVVPARNVSVALDRDHIHALIGPNGAGKSTCVNMLTGLTKVDAGDVRFLGRDITGLATYKRCELGLSRTFQNLRLFKDLSVFENVLIGQHVRIRAGFWSYLLRTRTARDEEERAHMRTASILAFTGLTNAAHRSAGDLPYGMQRRVEIARALAAEPHVLLLDEPAAGLNPQETEALGVLLRRIRDSGVTILLIEHHMDLVMDVSDSIFVLDYGEKIAEGSPDHISVDKRVREAYLGTSLEPGMGDSYAAA